MSQVSTEIEVSIGELPSTSGFQLSLDIGSGILHQTAIKSKLSSRLGQDPDEFKLYLSIPCTSADEASKLSSHLKSTYEGALASPDSPIGSVISKLKPDPDEPSLAGLEFSSYSHFAVITVSASQHEEQGKMFYEMAAEQAGAIFNSNNLIHFELDTGKNLGEILSPNMGEHVLDSALIKFVFTADRDALAHGNALAQQLGPQARKTQRLIALASLYNGASLKLNFKSGSHLPEPVRAQLNGASSMIPPLDQILPPDALTLINGIVEHAGHELFVNVLTAHAAIEVHLSAKGASQILQRN